MGNKNLNRAQQVRNDEYYTQLSDIEKELGHYVKHFKDKIVYCNTDVSSSNFVKFFRSEFHNLKLKLLVNSCIDGYVEIFNGYKTSRQYINGDFRSGDSIKILEDCDIVVTNPPFSLFRDHISQLVEHDKSFLIIGNYNAVTYKGIFPLIQNNKIWLGHTTPKEFLQPDKSIKKFGNIIWFTNLSNKRKQQPLKMTESYYYNEEKYPKYDNYDAIEIGKVKDIPKDYSGVMGVPITFLNKHNPEQFEIVGATESEGKGFSNGLWDDTSGIKQPLINGKRKYKRLFIKHTK